MSGKTNLKLTSSVLTIFILLMCFNNCAPLGTPMGTIGDTSISSVGTALAKTTFTQTVVPALQTSCSSCHSANPTDIPATTDIYQYGFSKMKLMNGSTSVDNELMNKLITGIGHSGGIRCASADVSPCKELKRWAVIEDPSKSTVPVGVVQQVTIDGRVQGYAYNPQMPAQSVSVMVYADGANGSGGTLLGTYVASGIGAAPYNNHYFDVQLPTSVVDAKQHTIYVYAGTANDEGLSIGGPTSFKAYGPTMAGQTYFNNTLSAKLSTCKSCHNGGLAFDMNYNNSFQFLTSPYPGAGGTKTNNTFIKNPMGLLGHQGGKFCSSASVEPCLSIQTWWDTEFNP